MEHLGDRNVGIDGVEKKVKNYENNGFRLAYRNIRYEGRSFKKGVSCTRRLVSANSVPLDKLAEYDRRFFPVLRPAFLTRWIGQPGASSFVLLEEDEIVGFGVIRPCRHGYKIGPLFADNAQYAEIIFISLVAGVPDGTPFYMDVPEINKNALELCRSYEMKPVFQTARMYNKSAPGIEVHNTYGVTSFELG